MTPNDEDVVALEHGAPPPRGPSTATSHSPADDDEDESTSTRRTSSTIVVLMNDLEAATEWEDSNEEGEEEGSGTVLGARPHDVEEGLLHDNNNNDNPSLTSTTSTVLQAMLVDDRDEPMLLPPVLPARLRLQQYFLEEQSGADDDDDDDDNSLSSSLLLDADNTDATSPGCDRCLDITGRLVCIPIALVVTVTTVTTVLAFCVLPSLLLIGTALTLYYCCTREPVPVRVLLRAMLLDEDALQLDPHNNNAAAPRRTKTEIQPHLLRRTCIAIRVNHDNSDPFVVPDGGLVVETADCQLYYSAPLTTLASSSSDPSAGNDEEQPPLHNNDPNNNSILLQQLPDNPEQEREIELVDIPILSSQAETKDDGASVGRAPSDEEEAKEEEDHGNARPHARTADHHDHDDPLHTTTTMNHNNSNDDDHSSQCPSDASSQKMSQGAHHERGTACDICLRRYRVGDTVAWSHNPVCNHAYHADCITDWLLHQQQQSHNRSNHNHSSCPNCRADFLYAGAVVERRKSASSRRASRGRVEEQDAPDNNNLVVPPV